MARRLTEENITLSTIEFLKKNNWHILGFDFPQSGTGVVLHSTQRAAGEKNKKSIIPDIIARRNSVIIFFENKIVFSSGDLESLLMLRDTKLFSDSIGRFLGRSMDSFEVSIGMAVYDTSSNLRKLVGAAGLDVGFLVNDDREIITVVDKVGI